MADGDLEIELSGIRQDFRFDIRTRLPLGGITAVLGPSGSGKTTLLRCLAGLERGLGGELRFGDEIWQNDETFQLPERRGIGYVFQDAALFPFLSVRKNLDFALKRATSHRLPLADVSRMTGIERLLDRRPHSLSGGERQRVALARALLSGPRLLLMDEPLASLDEASKAALMTTIEDVSLHARLPIIYVTHSFAEVARLAHRVVLLDDGQVAASGAVQDILARVDLYSSRGDHVLSVLDCELEDYDDEHKIAQFRFEAGTIHVPAAQPPPAGQQRLVIRASDVVLTLQRPAGTSALNSLPVRIDAQHRLGDATVLVRCLAGQNPLVAAVTSRSLLELGLAPGSDCFAQFKAAALS